MSLQPLAQLLPLPEHELQQILDYASTLSPSEAAEHFSALLGDSSEALDFISSFNAQRQARSQAGPSDPGPPAPDPQATAHVPKSTRGGGGKKPSRKPPLHTPPARKLEQLAPAAGTAYVKKREQDDYIPQRPAPSPGQSATPFKPPVAGEPSTAPSRHLTPVPVPNPKSSSNPASRSSTPKPAGSKKVTITGGTPMSGASSALTELDAAIRSLEMSTNPTLNDPDSRRCSCMATEHPLQNAAPNCLSCGKIICIKEGLGPCTFCGSPIMSKEEIRDVVQELKNEKSKEKIALNRQAHRKADVARTPAPFTKLRDGPGLAGPLDAHAKAAITHRDKLLSFQAQNAERTTVRDEASDFDTSLAMSAGSGGNMWASAEDRARELRRQQAMLREAEWRDKPEWEKRKEVLSIDVVGGRVVRKTVQVERPRSSPQMEAPKEDKVSVETARDGSTATASENPLRGALIKPVYQSGENDGGRGSEARELSVAKTEWRRVQDDSEGEDEAGVSTAGENSARSRGG